MSQPVLLRLAELWENILPQEECNPPVIVDARRDL